MVCKMVCSYVREIIHSIALVDYLHVQADKPSKMLHGLKRPLDDRQIK